MNRRGPSKRDRELDAKATADFYARPAVDVLLDQNSSPPPGSLEDASASKASTGGAAGVQLWASALKFKVTAPSMGASP